VLAPRTIARSPLGHATVSAAPQYTCSVRQDGRLWCWGYGPHARVWSGDTSMAYANTRVTRQMGVESTWATVSAAYGATCATRTDGTLWCWGDVYPDAIPRPTGPPPSVAGVALSRVTPTRIGTATDWREVSTSYSHACATRADDSLWCWGDNRSGQLGLGTRTAAPEPTQVTGTWRTVSTGETRTCGLRTDTTLWCWGDGRSGQLGTGGTGAALAPVRVGVQDGWSSLAAESSHACATRTDGTLWCWGLNVAGQVGIGSLSDVVAVPTRVSGTWRAVDVGSQRSCATDADGRLSCWGSQRGPLGSLAYAGKQVLLTPRRVSSTAIWTAFDSGHVHTCGVQQSGRLQCWGLDLSSEGALGVDLAGGGRRTGS
jgi:alpha-tubulin suppressor-like RCC1 family protein